MVLVPLSALFLILFYIRSVVCSSPRFVAVRSPVLLTSFYSSTMPFFKVLFSSNSSLDVQRLTICASTITELTSKAVTKTSSSATASYRVYDLADGSLIDEDECLIGLAEFSTTNKGEHLSVRIAPSDAQLEETNHQTGIPPIVEPQTPTNRIHTSTSGPNQDSLAGFPPLRSFILDLKAAAQSPMYKRNQTLVRTRRKTIKEIVQRIQNLPLRPGSLMAYSKKLYSGCPEGFDVYIKADTSSSMFPQFVRSLYNALDYAKSLEREGPRQRQRQRQRRRTSELEEELEDDVEPQVPLLCVDSNGCQEGMWDPDVPDADRDILVEKKRELMSYAHLPVYDEQHIQDLIQETYPLQREEINRARTSTDWNNLFSSWQILKFSKLIIFHANLLLGKDTKNLWYEEAANHTTIICFMESHIESSTNKTMCESMTTVISSMKDSIAATSSTRPNSIAVFPLLVLYLKEKIDSLYLLFESSTIMDDAVTTAAEQSQCPIILVTGSSIFDLAAKFGVLVRGKLFISTKDFIESVLVLLLCYFVFNINYPKSLARTLEFIQRFFLRINPEFQSRCEGSRKLKINAVVSKLAGALTDFELLRSRWSLNERNM